MKTWALLAVSFFTCSAIAFAQSTRPAASPNSGDIVELELLTHSEVYDRINNKGMTSVLIVTGGTEERGPHLSLIHI